MLALLSAPGKPLFTALLSISVARQILSGIYEAAGLALALSAVALYGGLALGLEDARHQEVLPLFRRGAADAAFQGFDAQLGRPEAEPGVRQQL